MLHNNSHSGPPSCRVFRSFILGETDEPAQPSASPALQGMSQLSSSSGSERRKQLLSTGWSARKLLMCTGWAYKPAEDHPLGAVRILALLVLARRSSEVTRNVVS